MEGTDPETLVGFTIFFLVIIGLAIAIQIALVRWVFRVNEQIALLTQIKDELRTLRLLKYPDKKPENIEGKSLSEADKLFYKRLHQAEKH